MKYVFHISHYNLDSFQFSSRTICLKSNSSVLNMASKHTFALADVRLKMDGVSV